jgi:hypothetical protein
MTPKVRILPGVYAQLADIFKGEPLYRLILGKVHTDLNITLPTYFANYQSNRPANSPNCFYFERIYSLDPHSVRIRQLRYIVRDSDPTTLEVIFVL